MKKHFYTPQIIIINEFVFNVEVVFFINKTKEEVTKWLKKNTFEKTFKDFNLEELDDFDDNSTTNGRMIPIKGGFLVRLKFEKDKFRKAVSLLAHEVSHTVTWMLNDRRTPLNKDTDELYAYMTEFFMREVLQALY